MSEQKSVEHGFCNNKDEMVEIIKKAGFFLPELLVKQ